MPVENFEQFVVPHAKERGRIHAPQKIRMIDVRDRILGTNGVNRFLHGAQQRRISGRSNDARHGKRVHMHRRFLKRRRHFFARQQQIRRVNQRCQRCRIGENVMIGEHEKGVAVRLIPLRDSSRRGIAIAVGRMGVRVPLVPPRAGRNRGHNKPGYTTLCTYAAYRRQRGNQQRARNDKATEASRGRGECVWHQESGHVASVRRSKSWAPMVPRA